MALQLRTLCLQLLQQGSNGLMAAVEYLTFLLEDVDRMERNSSQGVADVFMEVQRAIMLKLISAYDETRDHTVLVKFFDMFSLASPNTSSREVFKFQDQCRTTNSDRYTNEEVKEIFGLWGKTSDEAFIKNFNSFIRFWYYNLPIFSPDIFAFQFPCAELHATRPVTSAFDARWYLPIIPYICSIDDPLRQMPNLMAVVITSTTYLLNCWWLLHQADLSVASTFIAEKVSNLLQVIELFPTGNQHLMVTSGFGRLLRCAVFAMIKGLKLLNSNDLFFHIFVHATRISEEDNYIEHYDPILAFFAMFSREEISIVLDCYDDETKRPPSVAQHRFFEDDKMKQRLETVIEMEDGLPPLSRAYADILFLPDYVKDAIDSLHCDVITISLEFGVYTLMYHNKEHLPCSRKILRIIRRALKDTPILLIID